MPPNNLDTLFDDEAEHARIKAEAAFGWHEVSPAIDALSAGSRVLEVGCGTGYLLAQLSSQRTDIGFEGLEPIGQGFAKFEATLSRIESRFDNLTVHRTPIEVFDRENGSPGFDLVFSVNVFEHLDDWRLAIDRAIGLLKPGGQLIVLCPNYAVPYEPHFSIPIIGSAQLTRKLFDQRINRIETQMDSAGLWQSLNFITVPQLRAHCRESAVSVEFDRGVMTRMLNRLDTDPEFAERQAAVAGMAKLLRRLGAGWLLERVPARFSPYMKAFVRPV